MGTGDNIYNSKYSKLLTIILIVVIIAVVVLLGFLGYDVYTKYTIEADSSGAIGDFYNALNQLQQQNTVNETNTETNTTVENTVENLVNPDIDFNTVTENTVGGNTQTKPGTTVKYKGYDMIGTIQIPKTNIEYPIIEQEDVSPASLKVAICNIYGKLNEVGGNAVLVGHNYRNGTFFSNNKKLSKGDKIYITDNTGKRVTYIINNKYETGTGDFDYATRKVDENKRHISLSTCTDDSKKRLIIWATEE